MASSKSKKAAGWRPDSSGPAAARWVAADAARATALAAVGTANAAAGRAINAPGLPPQGRQHLLRWEGQRAEDRALRPFVWAAQAAQAEYARLLGRACRLSWTRPRSGRA